MKLTDRIIKHGKHTIGSGLFLFMLYLFLFDQIDQSKFNFGIGMLILGKFMSDKNDNNSNNKTPNTND